MGLLPPEEELFLPVYKRFPAMIDHGRGVHLYDVEGKKYLDFLSGIAVSALGHNHPDVVEALKKQLERNLHLSNYFIQDVQLQLASKLLSQTPYDKLFFANSGTEAIEGLIKLVRKWGGKKGKKKIIAFEGGFHGRTLGAVSITGQGKYRDSFEPLLPGVEIVPYNDVTSFEKALAPDVAAVFFEGITGEGGIRPVSPEMLQALKKGRDAYNYLIVVDEIQTGVGRTGRFYYSEKFPFVPDALATAKGLGGGLPLAAFLVAGHLSHVFDPGEHGTTYGGNPLACASGLATVTAVAKTSFLQQVAENGKYLMALLRDTAARFPQLCGEVRGEGLMCGMDVSRNGPEIMRAAFEKGLIFNIAGGGATLRFLPPLIVEKAHMDEAVEVLTDTLKTFQ